MGLTIFKCLFYFIINFLSLFKNKKTHLIKNKMAMINYGPNFLVLLNHNSSFADSVSKGSNRIISNVSLDLVPTMSKSVNTVACNCSNAYTMHNFYIEPKSQSNCNDSSLNYNSSKTLNNIQIASASSSNVSFNIRRKFSPEEDVQLSKLIEIYGPKKWDTIALSMPGRTGRQCRDRFTNYLDPSLTNGPWTKEEDIMLQQKVYEIGLHWNIIAKFFKGRSTNNIKNRWYTYFCKQKQYFSSQNMLVNNQKCELKSSKTNSGNKCQSDGIIMDNITNKNFCKEKNCENNSIIRMNENIGKLNSSNSIDQNQQIDFFIKNYKNEKKIFFPPISPPDNIFNFDHNQGILSFIC